MFCQIFLKKCQVFDNFLTVKWQNSGGSDGYIMECFIHISDLKDLSHTIWILIMFLPAQMLNLKDLDFKRLFFLVHLNLYKDIFMWKCFFYYIFSYIFTWKYIYCYVLFLENLFITIGAFIWSAMLI